MVVVVGKEPAIFFFPFLIQEPFADAKRFQERAPQASQRTTHPHTHTTKKKKKSNSTAANFRRQRTGGSSMLTRRCPRCCQIDPAVLFIPAGFVRVPCAACIPSRGGTAQQRPSCCNPTYTWWWTDDDSAATCQLPCQANTITRT